VFSEDDDDSTEMEKMTEISDILSMNEDHKSTSTDAISSSSVSQPSSSVKEDSTDMILEQTTLQARNIFKDIEAIPSDDDDAEEEASSTVYLKHDEQLVSSTSERVATSSEQTIEISPSAEPSVSLQEAKETDLPSVQQQQVFQLNKLYRPRVQVMKFKPNKLTFRQQVKKC